MRRGLVASRPEAVAAVTGGRVLVGGAPAAKPGRLVEAGDAIIVQGPGRQYVSRGGEKLAAALDHFEIDVTGSHALDAGASTGGFTDCLLQRGAASVVSVDVGRGQLHDRLVRDPRVRSLERTNIRHLSVEHAGGPFAVVVADLSFISLRTVADALLERLAAPGADVVVLIKPQFEAGRPQVSAGRGVIRSPEIWAAVLETVCGALVGHGAAMMGVMVSPLTGADGNVEFLAHLRADEASADQTSVDFDALAAEAAARHGRVG